MKVAKFQFSLFGINSYVVYDPETNECAVIDPGMINPEEENALTGFITRNNLKVIGVINTHLHIDHVAGNGFMKAKFDAPHYANEEDMMLGGRVKEQAQMFGMGENFDNVEIDTFLSQGDKIKIGNGELEVLEVPGHSQGSIALYDREGGYVIVGDALFKGSIGRTDLPGGDYSQLIESIKGKLLKLPPETVVMSGHGPETTIGNELKSNPFL